MFCLFVFNGSFHTLTLLHLNWLANAGLWAAPCAGRRWGYLLDKRQRSVPIHLGDRMKNEEEMLTTVFISATSTPSFIPVEQIKGIDWLIGLPDYAFNEQRNRQTRHIYLIFFFCEPVLMKHEWVRTNVSHSNHLCGFARPTGDCVVFTEANEA